MKNTIICTAHTKLPTAYGIFQMVIYKTQEGVEHIALIKGSTDEIPLVRIHSSCITGDIFSSEKCDCGEQLRLSLQLIQEHGSGIVLYLNQEGRGIGLTNKIKAYSLQEKGYDTVQANELLGLPIDARDYKVAVDILSDLGIKKLRLLTNNPDKIQQIEKYGLKVIERVALEIAPNNSNRSYLRVKKQKMSHKLSYV